jgi:hypothetical protein
LRRSNCDGRNCETVVCGGPKGSDAATLRHVLFGSAGAALHTLVPRPQPEPSISSTGFLRQPALSLLSRGCRANQSRNLFPAATGISTCSRSRRFVRPNDAVGGLPCLANEGCKLLCDLVASHDAFQGARARSADPSYKGAKLRMSVVACRQSKAPPADDYPVEIEISGAGPTGRRQRGTE